MQHTLIACLVFAVWQTCRFGGIVETRHCFPWMAFCCCGKQFTPATVGDGFIFGPLADKRDALFIVDFSSAGINLLHFAAGFSFATACHFSPMSDLLLNHNTKSMEAHFYKGSAISSLHLAVYLCATPVHFHFYQPPIDGDCLLSL